MSDNIKELLSDTKLAKPLDKANLGTDAAALRDMVGFLNNANVTGAVVPPEEKQAIADTYRTKTPSSSPDLMMPTASTSPPETPSEQRASLSRKLFFTGRLCAGKDFVAKSIGADVLGLADPIYYLVNYLFDLKVSATSGKELPGIRSLLQEIGQLGRNEVTEKYPYTTNRAMFCLMIRSLANQKILTEFGVDWGNFGLTPDLWINGLLNRAALLQGEAQRIAVTNCRFPNEYKRLTEGGFQAWHVVCSGTSWAARLTKLGLKTTSPEVTDLSEKLAADLNVDLTKKLSAQKDGNKLRVIWSDPVVPSPSKRLYTVEEFVALSKL